VPLIAAADTPTFAEIPGLTVRGCAAPSRGATETSTWHLLLAPGADGAPHSVTREEIFMVLAGSAVATVDGEDQPLGPGDTLIVPPGVRFALANPGDQPCEAIAVQPAGGQAVLDGEPFSPPWTR
jgi:mannose-6-phosphate isomerase-like protein (cupin superfamily)